MADTLATRRANNDVFLALGRVLGSVIFIAAGIQKLTGIETVVAMIEGFGLPYALILAWMVAVFETVAGVLLLVGFMTRTTGLALAAFCLFTGFLVHYQPGDAQQITNLMKNLAMAGGYLAFAAVGAGRFSLDGRNG